MAAETIAIVTAYNEADMLPATLAALRTAFPEAQIVVADDGSVDGSGHVALQEGAELVRSGHTIGKGGVATMAAHRVMARALEPDPPVIVLCDGDLGETAGQLAELADAVRAGRCDLAIGSFRRRVGGGFGIALRFAGWVTRRLGGIDLQSPISGQRALHGRVLPVVVPFAPGFGMETAMNVDAARAGFRIEEMELDLAHRATGKTLRGFLHRFRQLLAFTRVYMSRRRGGTVDG